MAERMIAKDVNLQPVGPLVQRASRQVNKLTGVVNDLLDITKIQAGRLVLNRSEFLLADLIAESIYQYHAADSDHEIKVNGDPGITVFADHNRLDQVICNLLTNAIKYSPDSREVNIDYEILPGGEVKVSVTDYGIGIEPEQLENIFDRFFRVEHTSQNFSGLGLGLFISSEIINRHNGRIGVQSTPGAGSTFWFTLPHSEQ